VQNPNPMAKYKENIFFAICNRNGSFEWLLIEKWVLEFWS